MSPFQPTEPVAREAIEHSHKRAALTAVLWTVEKPARALAAQCLGAVGAFDDEADFARHDLLSLATAKRLYRVPVYLDVGCADDLRYPDTAFANAVHAHGTKITFRLVAGGHSGWAARMPTYPRWYADACP